MSGPTPNDRTHAGADRPKRDEPRAHPRTMLVLAVVATVLAISSAPPRPASGGMGSAGTPAVLASAQRLPVESGFGALGRAVMAGSHALRAQLVLIELQAIWHSGLVGGLEAVLPIAPAADGTQVAWAEYLTAYSVGDPLADVTQTNDPLGFGFGCPDGVVDGDDLLYRLAELTPHDE